MQWELLNGRDFEQAVKDTDGVCILPIGPLERHGEHLPLGTDYMNAHKMACLAAEKEPAVVFPGFFFSQVCESTTLPGSVSIKPELIIQVLRNLYEEIYRNGFKKIIVLNGHGGNTGLLKLMAQMDLNQAQDYMVYHISWWDTNDEDFQKSLNADCEGRPYGHACEWETSVSMALHGEDSINLDYVPEETVSVLDRANGVENIASTGVNWFTSCPQIYVGNARFSTVERGKRYVEHYVGEIVDKVKKIKADTVLPELQQEYYRKSGIRRD